jgi:hypothetical protein
MIVPVLTSDDGSKGRRLIPQGFRAVGGDYFRDSKELSSVVSVEGAINVAELTDALVSQADLTHEHNFWHFDWAITLEVAEHIPKQFEDTFIRNIVSTLPKGIIISWAVPG